MIKIFIGATLVFLTSFLPRTLYKIKEYGHRLHGHKDDFDLISFMYNRDER